jgi:hypothetical protein
MQKQRKEMMIDNFNRKQLIKDVLKYGKNIKNVLTKDYLIIINNIIDCSVNKTHAFKIIKVKYPYLKDIVNEEEYDKRWRLYILLYNLNLLDFSVVRTTRNC